MGGKGRPVRKADNITAICEPTHSLNCLNSKSKSFNLRLAVYRQSVRLGAKSLKNHDQSFFSTEPLRS
jgi:hypothetical protein